MNEVRADLFLPVDAELLGDQEAAVYESHTAIVAGIRRLLADAALRAGVTPAR